MSSAQCQERAPCLDVDQKPVNKESEKLVDFEDVLEHVGGWGVYQKRLLVLFFFICIFFAYLVYTPILYLYEPDHHCLWPAYLDSQNLTEEQIVHLTIPLDTVGNRRRCHIYDVDFQRVMDHGEAKPIQDWPVKKCPNGWKYNFTGLFTTVVSDMDWVCDDSWKAPFSQSMYTVGSFIGTIGFGYIADHYGRFWTVMISNGVMSVAGFITPLCNNFVLFTMIRFATGISYATCFSSFYLLTLEYVSIEKRSLIGNLSLAVGLTLGGGYMSWLIKYIPDWKTVHYILFGQTFVVFLAPLVMDESVRWLASQNRIDECLKVVRRIAKTNGKTVDSKMLESFQQSLEVQNKEYDMEDKPSIAALFTTARLRRHSILMIMTIALCWGALDSHIRNIVNLDFSIYLTFTLAALIELPSDLLAIWGLETLGRRWSAFLSMFFSGVCMLVCGMAKGYSTWLVIVSSMVGRFCITYAINTIQQWNLEVFPTQLRGQGNALGNLLGQAAIFFSPYIVYSSVLDPRLPFFLLGVLGILGSLPTLFLPETARMSLPETLEEAEEFGKATGFFHVPFLADIRRRRRRITAKKADI